MKQYHVLSSYRKELIIYILYTYNYYNLKKIIRLLMFDNIDPKKKFI